MAGDLQRQFYNACVTIDYPCQVGTKYIDPCSCYDYFECQFATEIISRTCGALMYDHVSDRCDSPETVDVIKKLCRETEPQNRCGKVYPNVDTAALKARCTGTLVPTTAPSSTTTGGEPGGGAGGNNAGAIAGGVIGGLLVIVIIVLIIFFCKKRNQGKPVSHYLSYFKKPTKHPSDEKEETYTEIGDVMKDPVYNGGVTGGNPCVPERPGFTMSPALRVSQDTSKIKGRSDSVEVAYDNPGYTPADDDIIDGNVIQKHPAIQIDVTDEATEQYSTLDANTLEVPTTRSYTPLSIYTRCPNTTITSPESGGVIQTTDTDYQVPRPIPEYYDLEPKSNSVS